MFLMRRFTKLQIGDVDMVVRNAENRTKKHLIISYKSIYVNAYTIMVIDAYTGGLIFKHDSYCLWESQISSVFIQKNKDFVCLQAEGISVLSLSYSHSKKLVNDNLNCKNQIHSLPSVNYLKLEKQNILDFQSMSKEQKILKIQHQYTDSNGYTHFEDIYKLKIC